MILGSSLVVSGWDSARNMGSIFGGGTKIPHAMSLGKEKKKDAMYITNLSARCFGAAGS